jgi:hypothetical protein
MKRDRWYLVLIIIWLAVLLSPACGCMLTAPPQAASNPPAPITNNDDISSSSPEVDTSSPAADTTALPDETTIGNDPVSGQNQQIDLSWEDFCQSRQYQVQIAKDPDFSIIVVDTGAFTPASDDSPAAYYPAGGLASSPSSLTLWSGLESGHTYYWRVRVRQAASGQVMRSPWSEVKSFTIESGLPASTPSYGLQPVYPNNGRSNCPVKPVSFAWSPLKDATRYRFVLANDAAMTQVVKEAEVTTTAYECDEQLEYGEGYFWRVMALEPAPSDWSATFSFQTEAAPPTPPAQPAPQSETPTWAWVVIATGLALLIAIIVLLFSARRT